MLPQMPWYDIYRTLPQWYSHYLQITVAVPPHYTKDENVQCLCKISSKSHQTQCFVKIWAKHDSISISSLIHCTTTKNSSQLYFPMSVLQRQECWEAFDQPSLTLTSCAVHFYRTWAAFRPRCLRRCHHHQTAGCGHCMLGRTLCCWVAKTA